jgi:hypothetical protein
MSRKRRHPAVDAWIKGFTSRGGKARAKSMSASERSASAKKAAKARWADVSPKARSQRMRAVVAARWAKKRPTR